VKPQAPVERNLGYLVTVSDKSSTCETSANSSSPAESISTETGPVQTSLAIESVSTETDPVLVLSTSLK